MLNAQVLAGRDCAPTADRVESDGDGTLGQQGRSLIRLDFVRVGKPSTKKDAPSSAVRSSVRARPDVAYSYAPRMEQTKNQPAIVNVPRGDGRVVLFATNPCYRWQNHGEFNMLFNTILHYND